MQADVTSVLNTLSSKIGQLELELAIARDIIRQYEAAEAARPDAE